MSYEYKGYIRYFDSLAGEGVIRIPDLKRDFYVHYTASEKFDGDFTKFCKESFKDRTPIECNIYFDSHYAVVDRFKISSYCTREDVLSDIIISILDNPSEHDDSFLYASYRFF